MTAPQTISTRHVVTTALATAGLGLLAPVATFLAVGGDDPTVTRYLWLRAALVTLMLVTVVGLTARRAGPGSPRPVKAAAVGLAVGYLLNPFAWDGRAYLGQLLFPAGAGTALVDLVAWMLVGTAVAASVAARSGAGAGPRPRTRYSSYR
jgi:hypothetical protein